MASWQATLINKFVLPLRLSKWAMADMDRFARRFNGQPLTPAAPPAGVRRNMEVNHGSLRELNVTTVKPKRNSSSGHILFLHGGAYVDELLGAHWALIRGLIDRTGATVTVAHYPLAPSHTWRDAFTWLLELYTELQKNRSAGWFAIGGDSAGGGLTLAFAQHLRDREQKLPDRLLLLSPWLDVSMTDPAVTALESSDRMLSIAGLKWAGIKWAGDQPTTAPCVSPIYGSLDKLPPMAVFTGGADLLYADACRLKERARKEGVKLAYYPYADLFHVWMAAPIPEAALALDQAAAFLKTGEVDKGA